MAPRQSYGAISIKHEDEQEIQQLVSGSIPATTTTTTATDSKKKYFIIAALAIVAFVVVEFSYPKIVGKGDAESHSHGIDTSKKGTTDSGKGSSILSELSPVDLGFKSIQRESDASPSDIWGDRTGPLPTNSWYLVSHVTSWAALKLNTFILVY
jgi:hypothetical protein